MLRPVDQLLEMVIAKQRQYTSIQKALWIA